jgi:hypothetical protein
VGGASPPRPSSRRPHPVILCVVFYTRLTLASPFGLFRMPLHYFGFGYAALVATGGIIGYAKAGEPFLLLLKLSP